MDFGDLFVSGDFSLNERTYAYGSSLGEFLDRNDAELTASSFSAFLAHSLGVALESGEVVTRAQLDAADVKVELPARAADMTPGQLKERDELEAVHASLVSSLETRKRMMLFAIGVAQKRKFTQQNLKNFFTLNKHSVPVSDLLIRVLNQTADIVGPVISEEVWEVLRDNAYYKYACSKNSVQALLIQFAAYLDKDDLKRFGLSLDDIGEIDPFTDYKPDPRVDYVIACAWGFMKGMGTSVTSWPLGDKCSQGAFSAAHSSWRGIGSGYQKALAEGKYSSKHSLSENIAYVLDGEELPKTSAEDEEERKAKADQEFRSTAQIELMKAMAEAMK
jgi:hypothetical protein